MKKFLTNLVAILAVMLLVVVSSGLKFAHSATLDIPTQAQVIPAVGISRANVLSFGVFSPGASSGTINPTHTSISGPIESFSPGVDPSITVTGIPNGGVDLMIDPTCTISTYDGENSMVVDLSVTDHVHLGENGEVSLPPLTATLNVNANQPDGLYMGSCTITANY